MTIRRIFWLTVELNSGSVELNFNFLELNSTLTKLNSEPAEVNIILILAKIYFEKQKMQYLCAFNSKKQMRTNILYNFQLEAYQQKTDLMRWLVVFLTLLPTFCRAASPVGTTDFDWLVHPERSSAYVLPSDDGGRLTIGNAMVSRTFCLTPALSTISLLNRMTGDEMVRAVSPEALLTLDGQEYPVGGLCGQRERAYLDERWLTEMTPLDTLFVLQGYEEGEISEAIPWARSRWALNKQAATGRTVTFTLTGREVLEGITLHITYSVYDRAPVISKQMEVINGSNRTVTVDAFRLEHLAFVEPESLDASTDLLPSIGIHVESDYNCKGTFTHRSTDITTHWVTDPLYTTQRDYGNHTRCMLDVAPPIGPAQTLDKGERLTTFTVYEMPFDSQDRERQGLFQRHFYRTVAPWTTENPIFLHLTSSDPVVIRRAVDQCAETGYEMIIISFGSGLNAEDVSDGNIAFWKEMVDYAHSRGIEMGCYSLLASRSVGAADDCINPTTGKPGGMTFGNSPCVQSRWGIDYFEHIERFITETGMTCLEHDGSYPGDVCASTSHPGHKGLDDSQWTQFWKVANFYRRMCQRGVYLNVPDFYLLNGSTKVGIGYKETNWSLPRDIQLMHTRQLNYDCTYERPQSACWSFVPLTQYHGGGEAATIEPLHEHLDIYRTLMFQNYSSGVQACYRGPRLYDTEETKQAVIDMITWYKKYRDILNSDIIHLRRPDARDWDGLMHVNPQCKEKALAVLYNPLPEPITRTLQLPLYYTGLTRTARIREQEGKPRRYTLDREYKVTLEVTLPAGGYTWFVVE